MARIITLSLAAGLEAWMEARGTRRRSAEARSILAELPPSKRYAAQVGRRLVSRMTTSLGSGSGQFAIAGLNVMDVCLDRSSTSTLDPLLPCRIFRMHYVSFASVRQQKQSLLSR
jgi:hypothetical protein